MKMLVEYDCGCGEGPEYFRCEADDLSHAAEQLASAYGKSAKIIDTFISHDSLTKDVRIACHSHRHGIDVFPVIYQGTNLGAALQAADREQYELDRNDEFLDDCGTFSLGGRVLLRDPAPSSEPEHLDD